MDLHNHDTVEGGKCHLGLSLPPYQKGMRLVCCYMDLCFFVDSTDQQTLGFWLFYNKFELKIFLEFV